ncbi:MAG TPA: plasmid maintenance system killer protein [Spirochaetia bacterium]|nr:MAG: hypothetical protein A2Y41_03980 [Spirochaetes bacterium GWB1_36_13]HCL57746.1 plasmid maintenance system killer protein [Spirochaetia bacterium]
MEVVFNNNKLLDLYEKGKSNKYKLEKQVVKSFFEVISVLEAAKDIHDLWKMPSLNFEKLEGCKKLYSARLNNKYRLEMSIEWTDAHCIVGIIALEEISNHYGGR